MSILEQMKQSRVAASPFNIQAAPAEATGALAADRAAVPAFAPPLMMPAEEPEWTSGESRASRLQVERSGAYTELKARIHEDLITELDPEQLSGDTSLNSPIRRAVESTAEERLTQLDAGLSRQDRQRLASEIADEVLGYGPLDPLLRDPAVTEIMVNACDRIFCERAGAIQ